MLIFSDQICLTNLQAVRSHACWSKSLQCIEESWFSQSLGYCSWNLQLRNACSESIDQWSLRLLCPGAGICELEHFYFSSIQLDINKQDSGRNCTTVQFDKVLSVSSMTVKIRCCWGIIWRKYGMVLWGRAQNLKRKNIYCYVRDWRL